MTTDAGDHGAAWLEDFHAGRRSVLEQLYRDHFRAVSAAVGRVLQGADAESAVHEFFYRLLSVPELRKNFRGGNLNAWLIRVATNQAIDYRRKIAREVQLTTDIAAPASALATEMHEERTAKRIVERFRAERLPPKWAAVFETRFLKQLGQREAAVALGMNRTTLMYQEHRIRALLKRFVLTCEVR